MLTGGDGRYDPATHTGDALSNPGHDVQYMLAGHGRGYLAELGVEMPFRRRPLVRYCVDWSEQRHHLAGALGRAILDRFLAARWVGRVSRGRAVKVTAEGRTTLADWFGIDWAD